MSSARQRAQKDKDRKKKEEEAKLQPKARTPATPTLFGHTMHRGVGPDECIFVADKGNHRIQDIT